MIGLALVVLGIIVFSGHPQPAQRPQSAAVAPAPLEPSPDRLRDYQERLRLLDERARQHSLTGNEAMTGVASVQPYDDPPARAAAAGTADPLREERKRREYESLFASNIVMSRRPAAQQLIATQAMPTPAPRTLSSDGMPAPPSIDEVADAVVRATTRYGSSSGADTKTPSAPMTSELSPRTIIASDKQQASTTKPLPTATGPITSTGPLHRVLEGTVIDTVLTNRLDGATAAPVNCLVTNAVYSHDGQHVLIPAGSRVLGETKPVQTLGETRLAVGFNRLVFPDRRTYPLDQFIGLNDIGDAGLRDQVNQHYRSTFGASAAVGLITGFAQYLGTAAFSHGGDRTVIIAGNVGDATAQATAQSMNRFLNRLPTITIREGHRVKVYLTNDLELPPYGASDRSSRPLLAGIR
jgi:type IV secretion system protein VirB10